MKSLTFKNRKLLLAIVLTTITGTGLAASPTGFYVGAIGGSSDTHNSTSDFKKDNVSPQAGSVDSTGFGGRLFAGYRFDQFWAAEVGYTSFGQANGSNLAYSVSDVESGNINEQAADIRGKLYWPIADEVNPYVDAGAAYIQSKQSMSGPYSTTNKAVSPEYGLGVDFNINNNFAVGINWTRINQHDNIENADLLGLSFNIYF